MSYNLTTIVIVCLILVSQGVSLGIALCPAITPNKKITITLSGSEINVKTNCNRPGDTFCIIQDGDTTMQCVHDGHNWQEVK